MRLADLIHREKGNRGLLQKEVKVYNAFTSFEALSEYYEGD